MGYPKHLITSLTLTVVALAGLLMLHLPQSPHVVPWQKDINSDTVPKDHRSEKGIVFWNSFFGDSGWRHIMKGRQTAMVECDVPCRLSTQRHSPLTYDALVFHGRDHHHPPRNRTQSQVYIMLMYESPAHRGESFIKGDHFYNWSATYSTKSDFQIPYFTVHRRRNGIQSIQNLPQMAYTRKQGEAMVVWVASNCRTTSRREVYVRTLNQYIKVDIYGRCGNRCHSNTSVERSACHEVLADTGRYKFYLAFENSACRDYITNKGVYSLNVGLVPIVLGGLEAEDYLLKFPPGSFIDVRNFTSAKHLAEYLRYLDTNDTAYLTYHAWRREFAIGGRPNKWCEVCHALHNKTMMVPRNINWDKFWNPTTECDTSLIKTLSINTRDSEKIQRV